MELDLFYEMFAAKPWADKPNGGGQREREQRVYRDTLDQVKFADQFDFRTAWFVEHHFREGRSHCSAPDVVIGALSQITDRIRLGFGVALMPHGFTPPMRVAEKIATCDILSNGRIEWGVGRGGPMDQIAFGVDVNDAREQTHEAVESIIGMWENERFEFHGKFLDLPVRNVVPKPYQQPHPPVWMAANSAGSAATAGENGLGLLLFSIITPLDTLIGQIAEYKEAIANCTTPLTSIVNNRVAAMTMVNCKESMAECESTGAFDACDWWYTNQAKFFVEWEQKDLKPGEKAFNFQLLDMVNDPNWNVRNLNDNNLIIVGDPDQVYEKMCRFAEAGIDQLICLVQPGNLPQESALKTIELLGTEVIPRLKKDGVEAKVAFGE